MSTALADDFLRFVLKAYEPPTPPQPVFLSPRHYEAAQKLGFDMTNYRVTRPIPFAAHQHSTPERKDMTDFRKELRFGPFAGDRDQNRRVLLCTYNPDHHMNIYTNYADPTKGDCMCLSPEQEKQLRDALIEAYPLENTKAASPAATRRGDTFKVGDVIRRTGHSFRNVIAGGHYTVQSIDMFGNLSLVGITGTYSASKFTLVGSSPTAEQAGRFIVSLVEGGIYKPSKNPAIHLSRSAAEHEATRLAKLHGGTFHVLRVVHEASREVVVAPPVKTKSL